MSEFVIAILGCGNSAGVPAIGGWWGNCAPNNPKNQRMRPSIAILSAATTVIVDTGPDFKQQFNRENLPAPDAVIYTHMHADHTAGIDELRTLQRRTQKTFPVYADKATLHDLKARYAHMFEESENGFYKKVCEPHEIHDNEVLRIGDLKIKLFEQDHGTIKSLGLRIGNIAYSTDVKRLDDQAYEALHGVDIWIADAAGHDQAANPVHASVDEVIEMNKRIGAKDVYLTHLPPTMDYETLERELPEGFHMAYDGLRLKSS